MKHVIAVLVMALVLPAFADVKAGPGTQAVKTANDNISKLLKQKAPPGSAQEQQLAAQVTTSVRDLLDIDELGRRAMADHWEKLSPAQRVEFLKTLRALIEQNYVSGLRSNVNYTVVYTGESVANGDTIVNTVINTKSKSGRTVAVKIDYVLKPDGGKLKAWDVKTDGVGLVENYRQMFDKIISRDGFDALIAKMKKKQDELKNAKT